MKHFLIATNCIKDEKLSLTGELENYILKNGGTAKRIVGDNGGDISYEVEDKETFDGIIALGGDGTILKVSRDLRHLNIPIVGVNLGTLGFLTEIEPEQLFPVVDRLMRDDYELEKRMNICGTIYKSGQEEPILTDVALNDIVVSRAGFSRVIGMKFYVNGRVMELYEADGLIVSTPTGSTGYNLSAGGPIVSPRADLMIVTPVSPHSLTSKSIVLSGEEEIVIEILKMRKAQKEEAIVSFDGQSGTQLSPGDRIVIQRAKSVTYMAKLFDVSFYEVLREKISKHF